MTTEAAVESPPQVEVRYGVRELEMALVGLGFERELELAKGRIREAALLSRLQELENGADAPKPKPQRKTTAKK